MTGARWPRGTRWSRWMGGCGAGTGWSSMAKDRPKRRGWKPRTALPSWTRACPRCATRRLQRRRRWIRQARNWGACSAIWSPPSANWPGRRRPSGRRCARSTRPNPRANGWRRGSKNWTGARPSMTSWSPRRSPILPLPRPSAMRCPTLPRGAPRSKPPARRTKPRALQCRRALPRWRRTTRHWRWRASAPRRSAATWLIGRHAAAMPRGGCPRWKPARRKSRRSARSSRPSPRG